MKKEMVLLVGLVALTIVLMKTGGVGPTGIWMEDEDMGAVSGPMMGKQYDIPYKLTVLEELGFTFTEEEKTELSAQEYPMDYADLLFSQGMGTYDEETWAWSPSSDRVYALDTEVFNVASMYTDFLRGLESIGGGEVVFSDVKEEVSDGDIESGEGDMTVRFQLNGAPHTLNLVYHYDWLDCSVLGKVNAILEAAGQEKRYYAAWNNMQGMTIFYCDAQWAKDFERATGCRLFTKA